ncbi:MAG: O-antigen ligase family protein [Flammeovirgaceae bacterium]
MAKDRFLLLLLSLSVLLVPISALLSSRLLIVTLVVAFFAKWKELNIKVLLRQSYDLILFFVILLVGLIYSQDFQMGFRQVETNLSFIGIPLIFAAFTKIVPNRLKEIFSAFILGCLIASLFCLTKAIITYLQTGDIKAFFFYNFTGPIDSHPTYFAYYLIFAIACGLYFLYYETQPSPTYWVIALTIFLFLILLLTGGQTAYISVLLIFSFFILKFLLDDKSERKGIVAAIIVILTFAMFAVLLFIQNGEALLELSSQNDYWERMVLWESALKANTNPLLGVGTGDYNLVLNEYYRDHNLLKYANDNFNSHNQFVQIYFSNGIVGLCGLITLLARPLYLSIKYQNPLGVIVFFPFIIYGVTEVFLSRFQGVVFFVLIHQIFISTYYLDSVSDLLKAKKF